MTNEDRQRTMDFILSQQAQFAAHIQRLEEERIRDRPRLARLEKSFQTVVRLLENYNSRQDRLESRQDRLESIAASLETTMAALERTMAALKSSIINLDSRTTKLEDAFQRLVHLVENSETRLTRLEARS